MKQCKKFLSVLLSVLMIVTSCSVGFVAFAVVSPYDEDIFNAAVADLAAALKKDGGVLKVVTMPDATSNSTGSNGLNILGKVTNSSKEFTSKFTITCGTYEQFAAVCDIIKKVDAVMTTSERYCLYADCSNDGGSDVHCVNYYDVREMIKSALSPAYLTSAEMGELKVNDLLNNIFYMPSGNGNGNGAYAHNAISGTYIKGKESNNRYVPSRIYANTFVTTSDYKGYLASDNCTSDNVADGLKLGYAYYLTMSRENYHNALNVDVYPTVADPEYKKDTSKSDTISGYKTSLDSYVDTDFNTLVAKADNGTIDAFKSEVDALVENIKEFIANSDNADAVFDKLYPGYVEKLNKLYVNIDSAKKIPQYMVIADEYNDFILSYPDYGTYNYGAFDYDTLAADYADFLVIYNKLIAGGDIVDYLIDVANVITLDYYETFTDNVIAYDLAETVSETEELYNANKDTYSELTYEEQVALRSLLVGKIEVIESYHDRVQLSFYPDGHEHLYDLKQELDCKLNDHVIFFTVNTYETLKNADTADVIAVLDAVPENKSGLDAFMAEVAATSGEERAQALLGAVVAAAGTLADELYQLLADRFKEEVDAAYALYIDLGEPTVINIQTALKLSVAFDRLEKRR